MHDRFRIWEEYLTNVDAWGDRALLIDGRSIRSDCEPFTLIHAEPRVTHAVVLLHGLTDSPWYMRAIAERIHDGLGANVFVPLLQGHGLRDPDGMTGVSYQVWLRNAVWALHAARRSADRVSVGGLSTGGALATLLAFRDQDEENLIDGRPLLREADPSAERQEPMITGGVLLFSGALRLKNKGLVRGRAKELFLRTPIARIADRIKERLLRIKEGHDPLSGDDRYRYSTMDYGGAAELSKLIRLLDRKRKPNWFADVRGLSQPLFIAHSEADDTADIRALHNLQRVSTSAKSGGVTFFRIGKDFNVPHASVVLEQIAYGHSGSPIEPANPCFESMMSAALSSKVFH